ncbi:MAG: 30S ribosomal protein S20 [bacterium]
MPIKASAKKHLRQSKKRHEHNVGIKRQMHHISREVRDLSAAGKKDDAEKALVKAYQTYDKAAKRGIIHKNAASRTKARLSKAVKNTEKKKSE